MAGLFIIEHGYQKRKPRLVAGPQPECNDRRCCTLTTRVRLSSSIRGLISSRSLLSSSTVALYAVLCEEGSPADSSFAAVVA